jgi:hypothetical protein
LKSRMKSNATEAAKALGSKMKPNKLTTKAGIVQGGDRTRTENWNNNVRAMATLLKHNGGEFHSDSLTPEGRCEQRLSLWCGRRKQYGGLGSQRCSHVEGHHFFKKKARQIATQMTS